MYKTTTSLKTVIRIADGACISLPPAEGEGYKYAEWLAAGNTPNPADVPAPPTKLQRIASLLGVSGESRLTVQMMIAVSEDKATAMGVPLGMNAAAAIAYAYTKNRAYRACKDLETAIRAIEVAP